MKDSNIYKVKSNYVLISNREVIFRTFTRSLATFLHIQLPFPHISNDDVRNLTLHSSATLMMSLKRDQNWNEKVRRDFFLCPLYVHSGLKCPGIWFFLKLSSTIQFTWFEPMSTNKVYKLFVKKVVCICIYRPHVIKNGSFKIL